MNRLISLTTTLLLIYCSDLFGQTIETQDSGASTLIGRQALETDYQAELDKWMLQAYEGDQDAQFKVGALFTNDQFQSADMEQAVYWYKQAARQGHALAQYNLGHQYLTGVGVKRNEAEAMKWWLKAAEQEHPLAQFNIGRAYYLGIGLKEDHSQSKLWFRRAAKNNEPKSIDILTQLNWETDAPVADSSEAISTSESLEAKNGGSTNKTKHTAQEHEEEPVAKLQAEDKKVDTLEGEQVNSAPTSGAAGKDLSASSKPIAVYTDPSKRSVLIAILDIRDQLVVSDSDAQWTKVRNVGGFPVWVHQDFIQITDDIGTIQGNAVNARSVPLITKGSIVGRLNDGEKLAVLDKRNGWFRVMSPNRFHAWVKTEDFQDEKQVAIAPVKDAVKTEDSTTRNSSQTVSNSLNNNDWLFSQSSDRYTLQLASFNEASKVAEFTARKKFVNNKNLHGFTSVSKGKEWTYFAYGSYASSDEAKLAREEIGQKLAWIRSFSKLQQNRCIAWKKQIPAPKELNKYCS